MILQYITQKLCVLLDLATMTQEYKSLGQK